jgi:hypothetical protein
MKRSVDVCCEVKLRILDRGANAGTRREMNNSIRQFRGKRTENCFPVPDIQRIKVNVRQNSLDVFPFDPRIVKVVEVIDDRDGMPIRQQGFDQMGTNESCTTCHHHFHWRNGSKLGGKAKKRKEEVRIRFGTSSVDIEQIWNGI